MNFKARYVKNYLKAVGIIVTVIFTVFLLLNIGYLFSEFILHRNNNIQICDTCSMKSRNTDRNTKVISKIIHQIFFPVKRKTMSDELRTARQTWLSSHKNYTHYLWNETAIISFIRTHYPHLEPLYKSYDYWVRRVNVARYLILYHYGGWYVDTDMTCIHSLTELADRAAMLNKSVVQHYTFPIGTSNDFFGVTPRHQFLRSVLDHLPNSNRWFIFPYANTVLTTGTTYMWGRYLNYPYKDEFLILEQNEISRYIRHHHHSTWHGWDAIFIRLIVNYNTQLLQLIVSTSVIILILWLWKTKKFLKRTKEIEITASKSLVLNGNGAKRG